MKSQGERKTQKSRTNSSLTPDSEGLRDYILQATLNMVARHGIAATTYRMVAREAGVSLGAISHYFTDKQDLCHQAFTLFADLSVQQFAQYFAQAQTPQQARDSYIHVLISTAQDARETALGTELYALSLRSVEYRNIAQDWTHRCRLIMGQYFDAPTVAILDAFYEGVILHQRMSLGEYPVETISMAVQRIAPVDSVDL